MDVFGHEKRSWVMSRVRSKNTAPEIAVRSILHRLGYRFRLHQNDVPGHPDIVLKKHRTAVFVHGCFWHRHKNCRHATTPATNQGYWLPKFERTVARDRSNLREIRRLGWKAVVVWECELRNPAKLIRRLLRLMQ